MATILIATMDSRDYDVLSAEIEGEGHETLWAADGQDAVTLTLEHRPSLLLIDPTLPVYSGFEVADLLRGDPDVPKELPLLLLCDEALEPHVFDRSGFTAQFFKKHAHQEVRELLSRYATAPLLWG